METKEHIAEAPSKKDLTGEMKDYINLRIQLIRLNITEKISGALSGLISGILLFTFFLLFCLFASAALAFWLGTVFGSTSLGFIAVGGFYFLVAIVLRAFNKTLKRNLTDNFIADFSNDDDDE